MEASRNKMDPEAQVVYGKFLLKGFKSFKCYNVLDLTELGTLYKFIMILIDPCKDNKDCAAITEQMCEAFKETLQLQCPTKCGATDCKDDDKCKPLNLNKESCKLLFKMCPQSCAKLPYD